MFRSFRSSGSSSLGASARRYVPRPCAALRSRPTARLLVRPFRTSAPFEPLRPPSPASLGSPRPARGFRRSSRWLWRVGVVGIILAGGYTADRFMNASAIARTLRTFGTGLVAAVDYKLNFSPDPWIGGTVQDLHLRNAERLFHLLFANGGLYIKMGQAIAMQTAVLPPEFQRMFSRMFDDAPANDWADVEAVVREDFGRRVEHVFGVSFAAQPDCGLMERRARASGSVAQVHWARLADGREVAVKVQKREIARQLEWDLWAFKAVTWIYSKWFDLPLYSLVPYVSERLRLETDFINEAKNSEVMRKLVAEEPELRGRVYIPTVYPEFSSHRVLTAEWIEGVRLWDKDALVAPWVGGRGKGSPGTGGAVLMPPDPTTVARELQRKPGRERIKPERQEWRGRSGQGGLGLSAKEVMTTMIDLFSAQIFRWGVIHCDPHPGNMFVRRRPDGRPELVLIDHGLYVYMTAQFRRQYGQFWHGLIMGDGEQIRTVTEQWGIKVPFLFASATLMRPYQGAGEGDRMFADLEGRPAAERQYELQRRMKAGIRDILADDERLPKELLFIGRNLRIVQANNQRLGAPVNRIRRMGEWAARCALASAYEDGPLPWRSRAELSLRLLGLRATLASSDLAFYLVKLGRWLGLSNLTHWRIWAWLRAGASVPGGDQHEKNVEQQIKQMAGEMGVDLQHEVFEG